MSLLLLYNKAKYNINFDAINIEFSICHDSIIFPYIVLDAVDIEFNVVVPDYVVFGSFIRSDVNIITFDIAENLISVNYISPDITTVQFTFSDPKIWRSIIDTRGVSLLRLDTISLIELIKDELAINKLDNVDVVPAFTEKTGSIPAISVGHRITRDSVEGFLENDLLTRHFDVQIFAKTKGEREDIIGVLSGLYEREFITQDKRLNYIKGVDFISDEPLFSRPVSVHKNYYYLYFWGYSTYGVINHLASYDINNSDGFTIVIDVNIENDRGSVKIPIIDRYNSSTNIGYKVYIDEAKNLVFYVSFGGTVHATSCSFSQFLGKRALLTLRNILLTNVSTTDIYIDSSLKAHSTNYIAAPQQFSDYITTVGSFNDGSKTNIIPSLQAKMALYGVKISNDFLDPQNRENLEELPRNDYDLLCLNLNDGRLRKAYNDNKSNYTIYSDMDIYYGYDWVNYYKRMIKRGIICYRGSFDFSIESRRDQISPESWNYSNV